MSLVYYGSMAIGGKAKSREVIAPGDESAPERARPPEQMIESLKERYFMYPHFIEGVASGAFTELPKGEIDRIVNEKFFSFDPLTPLSPEQEDLLRAQTVGHIHKVVNRETFSFLCDSICYDAKTGALYTPEAVEELPNDSRASLKPVLPQEKLDMYFDPIQWKGLRLEHGRGSSPMKYYGNRDLVGPYDEYFSTAQEFTDLMGELRKRTGVERLKVLDIGCGMGKALEDMKALDPNLETHGITQEQEPGMFRADSFHYNMAERMPADFRNKFQFINSQIAFRYFVFQHIALRNVLLSLSRGGFARLGFGYDRMHTTPEIEEYFRRLVPGAKSSYDAMRVLTGQEMEKIDALQATGKIRYVTSDDFREFGNQGYLGIEKLEDFDAKELGDR